MPIWIQAEMRLPKLSRVCVFDICIGVKAMRTKMAADVSTPLQPWRSTNRIMATCPNHDWILLVHFVVCSQISDQAYNDASVNSCLVGSRCTRGIVRVKIDLRSVQMTLKTVCKSCIECRVTEWNCDFSFQMTNNTKDMEINLEQIPELYTTWKCDSGIALWGEWLANYFWRLIVYGVGTRGHFSNVFDLSGLTNERLILKFMHWNFVI